MLFLLPISRFHVDYQIARGRPYSYFERCVLAAVNEGANSLEKLEAIFFVHPRVVLEALVTLTQAGWLSVGNTREIGFSLTHAGAAALASQKEPRTRQVDPASQVIAMEALTGCIAPDSMVNSIHFANLGSMDQVGEKLPERIVLQTLNEAQIDCFLARRKDEWLLRVDKIAVKSRRMHWLPVEFNSSTRRFTENYPWHWRNSLIPALFELALREGLIDSGTTAKQFMNESNAAFKPSRSNNINGELPGAVVEAVNYDDFIDSNKKHESYLTNMFLRAERYILISSAFLRAGTIEALREFIDFALERGVIIDFLWGYNDGKDGGGQGVEALKKIEFDAKMRKLKGRINFNRNPTGSHAKISLFDRDSIYEASIGSYNWLSAAPAPNADAMKLSNVSLRLTNPVLISRLIRAIASFWAADERHLDEPPGRWRRIASRLEKEATENPQKGREGDGVDTAEIAFLVDNDHGQWLRGVIANAEERLTIMSHRLGAAAQGRLSNLAKGVAEVKPLVLYGRSDIEDDVLHEVSAAVGEAGGRLLHDSRIHAKMVISDNVLCLGSYNFLSTDTFDRAAGSKELSVFVKSAHLAKYFDKFVSDEYAQQR